VKQKATEIHSRMENATTKINLHPKKVKHILVWFTYTDIRFQRKNPKSLGKLAIILLLECLSRI